MLLSTSEQELILAREWPRTPYAIDSLFLPVLVEMEQYGCAFDGSSLESVRAELQEQMEMARLGIEAVAGYPVNPGSSLQMSKLFFEELGLPVLKRSKDTGKPSLDKEVLPEYEHPAAVCLSDYREAQKLISTYVDKLPLNAYAHGGRIKTCFNNTLVETGRLSSGSKKKLGALSINVQNIPSPKRSEWGVKLRRCFVAQPGSRLLAVDASQFQLRIAAVDSMDEGMIAAFLSGLDFHDQTAIDMFGRTDGFLRQIAKTLNFAMLFGASEDKVRRTILSLGGGLDRALLESAYGRYFDARPRLAERIQECRRAVSALGYLDEYFGRRNLYHIDNTTPKFIREKALREAYNFMIQGPEADIVKIFLAMIWRAIQTHMPGQARIVMQVHDEGVIEVEESFYWMLRAIVRTVEHELNELLKWPVPVVLSQGSGPNWADAH